MIQLVTPNLSVAGVPDYCLAYVQTVFGAPAVNDTAWHAWEATQFKHEDRNLPNVAVPLWCDWSGTVGGVYDNYGHVAFWTGSQVYTNPLSGSGHKVFPSIEAMETAYGVKFVGWSEDIETLRVVKGGSMAEITTEMVVALSLGTQGTQPQSKDEYEQWIGKSDQQSFDDMITHYAAKGQARQAALEAAAQPATVLKPGIYKAN